MKLAFSSRDVHCPSFLSLCRIAHAYGYDGFEIYDALGAEASAWPDNIFSKNMQRDSAMGMRSLHLRVSALTFPHPFGEQSADGERLEQTVRTAADCSVKRVILPLCDALTKEDFLTLARPAVLLAEKKNISLLIATQGSYCDTQKVLDVLRYSASPALGACWCVADTYFDGGETAETTIKNLGAYIRYVRLGDKKGTEPALLGEGDLPVDKILGALSSLDYESYLSVDWNTDMTDYDLVLTHFKSALSKTVNKKEKKLLYSNRSETGTFPFERYAVLEKPLSYVLDTMAQTYPDQLAFKFTTLDYTRTYTEFRRDVDRVAAAFIALGVQPGYHVAVWATNIPEWYLAFWAATKIGAVLVTVNTAYKIHEVEYLLRQSDTHTLIMISSTKDSDYKSIMEEICPELQGKDPSAPLYAKRLPFLRHIVTVGFRMEGCMDFNEMVENGLTVPDDEVIRRAAAVRPDDVCNMQYTSGTTGFPKGVMLTHRNVLNNGKIIGDRMDLSTADRMMIQVPMFHCFGMVLSMMSTMTHGGTLCPMPYFSPKSSLACIDKERITAFNGVPTMFIAMFNHADFAKTDFSSVRTGIMAGANCPAELMRRAAAEMNMKEIISVYGQTEASPGCTMGEVNEPIDMRVETVGSAFPGIECKIIDPETGEDLPDGQNGEFVVRGYNVMKGYYKMPEATAAAIDRDGWLHSGDICCRTPDGYYRVTGRLKDMIIRGGENIYPREIEEFYLTHPKIRDVQVIGVPDSRYGEEACAWMILNDGEQTTEEEMREYGISHMARHKVPRYFVFVREFPMNGAGKILKYRMKEDSVKLLGL